jgi:hypothetical protein
MMPVLETSGAKITVQRALRKVELLLGVVSLGAFALGCNVAEELAPARKAPVESVAKSPAAFAGVDGTLTVSSAGTVLNQYTTLAANAALGATSLSVASVAALANGGDALAPGDLVLVIQMQGATLDTVGDDVNWGSITAIGNAGSYEFAEVLSVDSGTNTIGVSCALARAYTSTGQVQVVRVPQYDTLTIEAGGTVTAPAWNGTTGGIVAVHAKTTLSLAGTIDVTGLGFRGGLIDNTTNPAAGDTAIYASTDPDDGGRKGEGVGGFLVQYGRAPMGNGGGGGNAHNGGGGGGSNARSGGGWTGQGRFDLLLTGGSAYNLDPNFSATASEGGGRGGYTYSSSNQNALALAPGGMAWGGNLRRERGGLGGRPLDNDPANRVFFGGGGGAGDANNGHAGAGGPGGGIVFVLSGAVTGTGSILANGAAGVDADSTSGGSASGDSPGGGGGGGTVIVSAATVSALTIAANGGAGGRQIIANGQEAEGPGGGGGGGYVAVTGAVTASVLGGAPGTTNSPALTEFPANGATTGGAGQALLSATFTPSYCVDSSLPGTSITAQPVDPTNDTTGEFSFTSDDPSATFECAVDGGAFTACTTPFTTAVLAEGSHTFAVRAKDAVGNLDATPATFTWVIDTTPPDTNILTNPSDPSADATGDFTFDSDESDVTYECNLDGGGFVACAETFATPALTNGSHTLEVRAIDEATNVDPTPDTYTWVVAVASDEDGDGLPDEDEETIGTDPEDADSDDDGVPDGDEPSAGVDSDDDGLINARDPDSDNDGIFDGTELGQDCSAPDTDTTQGHCVPDADPTTDTNPLDRDTDDGGIPDGTEDANHDGEIDTGEGDPEDAGDDGTAPTDTDGDGLSDDEEDAIHTDPLDADSDDDGVLDGAEPNPSDDVDGDGLIGALDPDSDDDGLFDGTELGLGCDNDDTDTARRLCVPDADDDTTTSPLLPDTDGGGARDGSEDANLNGALDSGETDPTTGHAADDDDVDDTDGDGLGDELEDTLGSDPTDDDSDDDGVPDGDEANPSADADADGLVDVLDVDSDNDGLFDGTEVGLGCGLADTNAALGHCRADADPGSRTSPVNPDTDFGGERDGSEDGSLDGELDAGEQDPTAGNGSDDASVNDYDGDGLSDATEGTLGSDPDDSDSDDDGLVDGSEPNPSDDRDGDGEPDVLDPDSDGDGLFDGTEAGLACDDPSTDAAAETCIADGDPDTTTGVLIRDTDRGGVTDGMEDSDHDGSVDSGERDPLDPSDDTDVSGEGGASGAGGEAGSDAGGTGGDGGSGATGGTGGSAGASAGQGGTSGTAGSAGASAGGSAGTATGGTGGDAATGGSSGAGGSTGGSGGVMPNERVVVLGGGFCSTGPARSSGTGWWAIAALGLIGSFRARRRGARAE